ncbi:hypothetical protein [Paenibacillus paeoniae]|nr:hypothetical protein [Paenibacillus paeoniae]
MHELEQLYEETLNMVEKTEAVNAEELIALVDQREKVIHLLEQQGNLSTSQKEILFKISEHDASIQSKMELLRDEAAQALNKLAKTRIHKNKYEAQYTGESFFVDMRE